MYTYPVWKDLRTFLRNSYYLSELKVSVISIYSLVTLISSHQCSKRYPTHRNHCFWPIISFEIMNSRDRVRYENSSFLLINAASAIPLIEIIGFSQLYRLKSATIHFAEDMKTDSPTSVGMYANHSILDMYTSHDWNVLIVRNPHQKKIILEVYASN